MLSQSSMSMSWNQAKRDIASRVINKHRLPEALRGALEEAAMEGLKEECDAWVQTLR